MVKSPELAAGSPSRTAICAPGGTKGGAGPHLIWSEVNACCGVPDWATRIAAQNIDATARAHFMDAASCTKPILKRALSVSSSPGRQGQFQIPAFLRDV